MRDANERLVLTLVRRNGSLSKSEIARATGLSLQTVSVIMRELEQDGLLLKQAPVRGKVGQPSVPMSLDPEGAFFIGLKLGRRSAQLALIDLLGEQRAMLHLSYAYPTVEEIITFVARGVNEIAAPMSEGQKKRIAGMGIAMPFELWNWADAIGAPRAVMDEWRHRDVRADIQSGCPFPVYLQNDATAACGAELVLGSIGELRNFLYFYVGAFAGGGVVLDGALYTGPSGNAGALGSMPVPGPDGRPRQLIDIASVATLDRMLQANGKESGYLWTDPEDWGEQGKELDTWLREAARALAYAIISASAVIDFEEAVIDGWMPPAIRGRLVAAVREALADTDAEGLVPPQVREGTIGIHARALGAAAIPLSERFMLGRTDAAVARP
ncbi:MAG: ROK family transcriptional regulator [Rhizobiaceae bacterium]